MPRASHRFKPTFAPYGWLRNELRGPRASRLANRLRGILRPVIDVGVARLYCWDLASSAELPVPAEFLAREVGIGEMSLIAAAFDRPLGELYRRLRLGDRCFCTFADGMPVHMRWGSQRPIEVPELDLFVCPAPDEVYVYDAVTAGAWRGKFASSAARKEMDRVLRGAGIRRAFQCRSGAALVPIKALGDIHNLLFQITFARPRGGQVYRTGKIGHPLYTVEGIPAPEAKGPPKPETRGGRHRSARAERAQRTSA